MHEAKEEKEEEVGGPSRGLVLFREKNDMVEGEGPEMVDSLQLPSSDTEPRAIKARMLLKVSGASDSVASPCRSVSVIEAGHAAGLTSLRETRLSAVRRENKRFQRASLF